MSEWLFDLGNSRLKCAPVEGDGVGPVHAIEHDGIQLAEGWEALLPAPIDAAWVSSVAASSVSVALLAALAGCCRRICIARTQATFAGVRIAYAQPSRLGVDRFLALLAARARTSDACMVVGVGTALTVDWLDADGVHRGGRIAPSPALMREALHARVKQLPLSGGQYSDFAADTADALASGCEGAALGLVAGSLAAASRQGPEPGLFLHGGGAGILLPHLPQAVHAPALVLEGLLQWRRAATAAASAR